VQPGAGGRVSDCVDVCSVLVRVATASLAMVASVTDISCRSLDVLMYTRSVPFFDRKMLLNIPTYMETVYMTVLRRTSVSSP